MPAGTAAGQSGAAPDALSEAGSIGAWEALNQPAGVELRDSQGRLISRAGLQKELAEGARRGRDQAAGLSSLKAKRAWLKRLDRVRFLLSALRGEGDRLPRETVSSFLPPAGPKAEAALVAGPAARAPIAPLPILSPLELAYAPGHLTPLVLRC